MYFDEKLDDLEGVLGNFGLTQYANLAFEHTSWTALDSVEIEDGAQDGDFVFLL